MARLFTSGLDLATVTTNLSGQTAVTVSLWLKVITSSHAVVFEYSATTNGFDVIWSQTATQALVRSYGPALEWADLFTFPTDGQWHAYLFTFNAGSFPPVNEVWIDGVNQPLTTLSHAGETYTWANTTLTIAGRVGTAPLNCAVSEFTLWNGIAIPFVSTGPPDNQAKSVYAAIPSTRWSPWTPTVYVPFIGDSPEPDYTGNHNGGAVLTGSPPFVPSASGKTLMLR